MAHNCVCFVSEYDYRRDIMEKIMELMKNSNSFRYWCTYSFFAIALIMTVASAFCLRMYSVTSEYDYLFASKELLASAFGVVVIALANFHVLDRIYHFYDK